MSHSRGQEGYFSNLRPEMLPFVPAARARILEIGCGEGRFAASIEDTVETWGIEPNVVAAERAAQQMRHVLIGYYDSVASDLPNKYFDVVVCNDVIEHMVDHDLFFTKIKQKIRPGGALIGSVPNVRFFSNLFDLLVLKDWDYKTSGILDHTHLRFFTKKSLRRSLIRAGYTIDLLRGVNGHIRVPRSLRQLVYVGFGCVLIFSTMGYCYDTSYMQLAFRATPEL